MSSTLKILPNPGGTLTPDQVIGRDALIASLWETLRVQSVVLVAPRRMGKSSLCWRMHAQNHGGFIRGSEEVRDLEGRSRAADLVELLFEDTADLLKPGTWAKTKARKLLSATVGKAEIKGISLQVADGSWRALMETILAELNAYAAEKDKRVVLFWDEFPYFLDDMRKKGHAQEAMALLDLLRAARQRHHHLRMVLTGSIGLHEVIDGLRSEGYSGDPTNDMAVVEVPLLDAASATSLSLALLRGTERVIGDIDALATHLGVACEGHPYLIQKLAQGMRGGAPTSKGGVDAALTALIDDAQDPLHLGHYIKRLAQLYGPERQALATKVLDVLALSEEGLTLSELVDRAGGADREALNDVLRSLRRDHYVNRDAARRYRFRLSFLRRYWVAERGL